MKTRLQLLNGLKNGTLSKDDEAAAFANPNVVKAIAYHEKLKTKKRKSSKKKGEEYARHEISKYSR